VRRCVWSRNLKNEDAMAPVGPQSHNEKRSLVYNYNIILNNITLVSNNEEYELGHLQVYNFRSPLFVVD